MSDEVTQPAAPAPETQAPPAPAAPAAPQIDVDAIRAQVQADVSAELKQQYDAKLNDLSATQKKAAQILLGQQPDQSQQSAFMEHAAKHGMDSALLTFGNALEQQLTRKFEAKQAEKQKAIEEFNTVQAKYSKYDIPEKAQKMLRPLIESGIRSGQSMKEATTAAYDTVIESFSVKEKAKTQNGTLPSGAATFGARKSGSPADRLKAYRQKANERAKAVRGQTRKP